jgi:hypothetical protein
VAGVDAAFVMGGGKGGPPAAAGRPVVSGLQTPRNKGILAALPIGIWEMLDSRSVLHALLVEGGRGSSVGR